MTQNSLCFYPPGGILPRGTRQEARGYFGVTFEAIEDLKERNLSGGNQLCRQRNFKLSYLGSLTHLQFDNLSYFYGNQLSQMDFENRVKINNGIYTVPDVSKILRLPYQKVNFWLNKYWDSTLGGTFEDRYSWTIDNTRAVSFHTLIEFFVFYHLSEVGVKPKEVLKAHIELSKMFDTPFPFAMKNVLESIRTTGRKVFLDSKDGVFSLDGNKQFNLDFIKMFFKNLDFDGDLVAARFYPLGKGRNIMIDPRRQFGHPVLGLTNIYPETIYNLYKAGEPLEFLAFTYELGKEAIIDAIEYCEAA